ncbi:MAG: PHP domain-containing protein [Clostridiales bacterium]|nr:PHP domain-containing protein [Clostridiales bacterium]
MKFDLHCHTKEGSIDSRVSVREYAGKFMMLGYDGFMISDHNSYRGCKSWDKIKDEPQYENFTVIRGIEYDTKDAGHVLVIMPDGLYLNVFRLRGMRCKKLIKTVHEFGGILGLAHPFGVKTSSAMGFKLMNMDLIKHFDFIETFNYCEFPRSNELAEQLAHKFDMPAFGGSDAHTSMYIGMASTIIDAHIKCNNDFIAAVKCHVPIYTEGTERGITKKAQRKEHWTGQIGYMLYNRGIGKIRCIHRKYQHHKLFSMVHQNH